MNQQMWEESWKLCQDWTEQMTRAMFLPWQIYLGSWEQGVRNLAFSKSSTLPEKKGTLPLKHRTPKEVEKVARERIEKGYAPPAEIYLSPIREQIDWSNFPLWARPSDPELFEGSAHEG